MGPPSALRPARDWPSREARSPPANRGVASGAVKFEPALRGFVYFWYCLLLCIYYKFTREVNGGRDAKRNGLGQIRCVVGRYIKCSNDLVYGLFSLIKGCLLKC